MSHRRGLLALSALVIFACYAVHMDETQIRTIASQDMDCDEQLVHLENGESKYKNVARYVVHGCEKVRTYDCMTDADGRVTCDSIYKKTGDTASNDDGDSVAAGVGAAAAGCACASLFGSHSSDPPSSAPASNPNSTPPQRNR
jgi:hypothetical protein